MKKFIHISRLPGNKLGGLLLLLVLFSLPLRAEEPTASKAIYNTFSDEEEMAMGRKAAEETDRQVPLLNASLLLAYLNNLGQKVAQASRRPQIQYSFKIVNTDTVNAFSLPGGFVYIHRGLLDFVVNESELAGVMAHEVGHIVAYHSMNDVARRALVDRGMYELQKAGVLSDRQVVDTLQRYGGPILLFADRKFSREEESEADMLGIYNTIRAGYDPLGLVTALARLSKFTGNPTLVEALLMNHPLPGERVTALRAELQQNPPPKGLEKDSAEFQAAKLYLQALPPPPPAKKQP
ncbi:MAG: M48 family metalloprotease [Terriglobia bacterium]|jgi:predicted Zn-dependent protease